MTSSKTKKQPVSSATATKICVLHEAKRRTTEVSVTFSDDHIPMESDDDDDFSDLDDEWIEVPEEYRSNLTAYLTFLRSLKKRCT